MKRYLVIVRYGFAFSKIANVSETNSLTNAKRNFTYWKRKYKQNFYVTGYTIKIIDRAQGHCIKYQYVSLGWGI